MNNQKTYCVNADCPFKECDKHLLQLKKVKDKSEYIKVASLDSVCKDYLHYLLDEVEESEQGNQNEIL